MNTHYIYTCWQFESFILFYCFTRKRRPELESDVRGVRTESEKWDLCPCGSISIPGSTARVKRLTIHENLSWAQIVISTRRTWTQDKNPSCWVISQRDGGRHEARAAAKLPFFLTMALLTLCHYEMKMFNYSQNSTKMYSVMRYIFF